MATRDDAAEEWFYDLGVMARRIEAEERRQKTIRQRQYVVASFALFAFLLLSWRSEVNADRIDRNTKLIADQQVRTCENARLILTKFNELQDKQIAIERMNPYIDEKIRDARVAAYTQARVTLPECVRADR